MTLSSAPGKRRAARPDIVGFASEHACIIAIPAHSRTGTCDLKHYGSGRVERAGGEAGPGGRTARLATVIRTLDNRNEAKRLCSPNQDERTEYNHAVVAHFPSRA